MLLIYTPHITNRIQYIMQYIFEEKFGINYQLINNIEAYKNDKHYLKIAYANQNIQEGLFFYADTLLFQENIQSIELNAGFFNNIKVLFAHSNNLSALPFDVFAAIFYLLSRYEEYLNEPLDKFQNYNYSNSILFKQKILDTPIVEQWLELLKEILLKNFPYLQFKNHTPKFALSFDIDVAYAYKNRSIAITAGGIAKKIIQLNFNEVKNQLLTLLNKKKDKYDTYAYIFSSIKNKKPIFFFDMGDYGKFDKNPSWKNKEFQQLIKKISDKANVGLHPSYTSNSNKNLLTEEKNRLEKITGNPVTASRQHFLKLKLPYTYNDLINSNISADFTMGYSAMYGFRAGTCNSFLFFDLTKNEATTLRLYPFAYMDATLNNYLHLNIEEAKKNITQLAKIIHTRNGIFIPLWHNSTLCNCAEWKNWRSVFEHTLHEIDNLNFKNLFD